jgi:hypothetical protein
MLFIVEHFGFFSFLNALIKVKNTLAIEKGLIRIVSNLCFLYGADDEI